MRNQLPGLQGEFELLWNLAPPLFKCSRKRRLIKSLLDFPDAEFPGITLQTDRKPAAPDSEILLHRSIAPVLCLLLCRLGLLEFKGQHQSPVRLRKIAAYGLAALKERPFENSSQLALRRYWSREKGQELQPYHSAGLKIQLPNFTTDRKLCNRGAAAGGCI